ncbi:MAG TPA: YbhN family protein [bacterium]|nr:YbhN family protein [bacterium]
MPGEQVPLDAEVSAAPSLTVRLARYVPTLVLAGLAIHWLLPQWATFQNSFEVIKRMSVIAVAGAALAQILSYVSTGYVIRLLVACVGNRISVVRSMVVAVAAASIGLVAGGVVGSAAAAYRLIRRGGVCRAGGLLAGWVPPLFNNAVLLILSLLGLLEMLILRDLPRAVAISFGVLGLLLAGFAGIIVWGVYHRSKLRALAERLAGRWAVFRHRRYDPTSTDTGLEHIFQAWDLFRSGGWRGPAIAAFFNCLFDMLTLYLVFVAAGHPIGPGMLLAGYGLPLLIGKFTFLPGGIGVVEGGMVAMYTALGVPHAVTVIGIIAYRILSFWLPSLLGFPLFAYMLHAGQVDPDAEPENARP